MAKQGKAAGVNKSQAIRDFLATNPGAVPKDVVAGLQEKGIDVSPGLVGLVKYSSTKKKPGRKPGPKPARASARRSGSKSDAVRSYLAAHPDASPIAVRDALKANGIKISASLASAVKYAKGKKAGRPKGRRGPGRPRLAARTVTNGALDLELLVEAKRLADRLGGIDSAREALAVLAKLA